MLAIVDISPQTVLVHTPTSRSLRPPALSPQHEALNAWYWGNGIARFERSPQGEQLERAKVFALQSEECGSCQGSGFVMPRRLGTKLAARGRMQHDVWDSTCLACCGMGVITIDPGAPKDTQHPKPPKNWTDARKRSYAAGPPPGQLTAQPIFGEVHTPSDGTREIWEMSRYATMGRYVSKISNAAAHVLYLWWGDQGARWADEHALGRQFAVYPKTPSGRKMVAKCRREGSSASDHDVLCAQYTLQIRQPDPGRAGAFAAMKMQSQVMYWGAVREFNAVAGAS